MNQVQYNALTRFGYSGSLNDMLLKFYRYYVNGNESLPDTEHKFLSQRGFTTGTLNDRWYAFLKTFGYTGSLTEMMYKWWTLDATMPMSLFMNGEQGWVYDPSNLSTLFQDAAGTTPVTAMEQPVGLQLDTRLGAPTTLGAELVTNGDFSNGTTGWAAFNVNSSISVVGGEGLAQVISGPGGMSQTLSLTVGRWYSVTASIRRGSGDSVSLNIVNNAGTAFIAQGATITSTSLTTVTLVFSATETNNKVYARSTAAVGASSVYIDNISVRELPGNHRYQTTSANRPVVSARVNLLTKTEQFDDAVWSKGNATIGAGQALTRGPTNTTESLVFVNVPTQVVGTSITSVVRAKQGSVGANLYIRMLDVNDSTTNGLCVFDLGAGTVLSQGSAYASATINSDGAGGFICKVVGTKIATTAASRFDIGVTNLTSGVTGTSGQFVYLISADYRLTNIGVGLPAYQRVNTSTDYDTAGFPVYIKPNGSNQFMVTNSINFSATDKMTVWAGVRKLSDAALGMFSELGTGSGAGRIYLGASPSGSNYITAYAGSGTQYALIAPTSYPAPITNVTTVSADIAAPNISLEINSSATSSSTSVGTGNFGNYPVYFYMRAGASLPFNGHDYGSIGRGASSSAAEIASAKTWINQRTKAY